MISGISTRSIHMALQRSLVSMQREMASKQVEVQTGKFADVGLSLGEKSSAPVSLLRDVRRLESILDTNKTAATRLEVTQNSLSTLRNASSSVLAALTAGNQSSAGRQITAESARTALASMTSALNVSVAGQHIFAGLNSDVAPINAGNGIPAGNEMDAAFAARFGFDKTDPAAAAISVAAFDAFVTNDVEPMFKGTSWKALVSTASDSVIQSRITLKEVLGTSVSVNENGIRDTLYAAALAANFLNTKLSTAVADDIVKTSVSMSATAGTDLATVQSKAGLVQSRVSEADTRITTQRDILLSASEDLTSVDPYQTSVRLNSLLTQIETSYALTQKIQNLSILRYLG
jgi:flagellar hook-associated protein 3 FlgL